MKRFIKKYHLVTGLILATVLPGTFIFSTSENDTVVLRFLLSFTYIFASWLITFLTVDFSPIWLRPGFNSRLQLATSIVVATFLTIAFYMVTGTLDGTGTLLSQLKGDLIYSPKAWFYLMLRLALLNGLVVLIKYFYDFSAERARIQSQIESMKRERIMATHEALKQQLNPHFLFNSLNTLKSLIKQDTRQSLYFVEQLASTYRYMLVHSEKDEVTLKDEIEFLRSYLSLLKIRFGEALEFDMNIPDRHLGSSIPPNTLQVLIENAVKHNTLTRAKPLQIAITANGNYIDVENNLQHKLAEWRSSNVGLSNIDSRYRILKGQHIIVEKNDRSFRVRLPIDDSL